MNAYVTGQIIKDIREKNGITQSELAQKIGVTDKAISKWETSKGLPDITLIEPLANALSVSVAELISGEQITNKNRSANIKRTKFFVCPICGNVLTALGDTVISCCGINLPPLEPEATDKAHEITIETVDDERFIKINHEMTKTHYISFLAYLTDDRIKLIKFYPEGNAETRIKLYGDGYLYVYCNKHGLMKQRIQ